MSVPRKLYPINTKRMQLHKLKYGTDTEKVKITLGYKNADDPPIFSPLPI